MLLFRSSSSSLSWSSSSWSSSSLLFLFYNYYALIQQIQQVDSYPFIAGHCREGGDNLGSYSYGVHPKKSQGELENLGLVITYQENDDMDAIATPSKPSKPTKPVVSVASRTVNTASPSTTIVLEQSIPYIITIEGEDTESSIPITPALDDNTNDNDDDDDEETIGFKGFLFRLSGINSEDASTVISILDKSSSQKLQRCNSDVSGISHSLNTWKTNVPIQFYYDKEGEFQLEVTVVKQRYEWAFSSYTIRVQPPSFQETAEPSVVSSTVPTIIRSGVPSSKPSLVISTSPSDEPTYIPSVLASSHPTEVSSISPSTSPSASPSVSPFDSPSYYPSVLSSTHPTNALSNHPSILSSSNPTLTLSSSNPIDPPSSNPIDPPSLKPTTTNTLEPTIVRSSQPFSSPSTSETPSSTMTTIEPTNTNTSSDGPSLNTPPTQKQPTSQPTSQPTISTSINPTLIPSVMVPTHLPTTITGKSENPSEGVSTSSPTYGPSSQHPSTIVIPTSLPTVTPTASISQKPSKGMITSSPTSISSTQPTLEPTISRMDTSFPSVMVPTTLTPLPTVSISEKPVVGVTTPSPSTPPPPTHSPTSQHPSMEKVITSSPTMSPSDKPSEGVITPSPTMKSSQHPSLQDTINDIITPSPTTTPTASGSTLPSSIPMTTVLPTSSPSDSKQPSSNDEDDDDDDEESSCMSGHTRLFKVNNKKKKKKKKDVDPLIKSHLRSNNLNSLITTNDDVHVTDVTDADGQNDYDNDIVELQQLQVGDVIRGYDQDLKSTICSVEAIGTFGFGELYGNYTKDHYILNPLTGNIEEHGPIVSGPGSITKELKYEILTSCPLGIDESGTKFTPIDTDFCGEDTKSMSWSDYVLLHTAILRVVRETGGFWFSGSSYRNFRTVKKHSPNICSAMLKCMKDHEDCHDLERESLIFIENTLTDSAKSQTYGAFYNIGDHRKLGSVSASVSKGKSVRN